MNTRVSFSNRSWKAPNKLKRAQPIIVMKIALGAFLVAGVGLTAVAQSFYNLDFELASGIPASPGYPSSIPFSQAFPGWTGYCGAYQQTAIQYDYEWLDSAGFSLFDSKDTNEPVTGVMHGRYCACLYSGVVLGTYSDYVETWIAQTGGIPPSAASILFNFSPSWSWGYADVRLTFNGIPIPCSVVSGGGTGPSVLGGDVSQFAGQVGELRFTAPNESTPSHPVARSIFLLDNIRFSSQPSPPSAPIIGTSPQSQTVDVGTTVDFAVTVGGSAPLTYQWFFNQTNTLQGATNSTLELVNVQPGQAGTYMVAVSNSFGTVASAPATLIVNASPPSIVTPPLSQTTNVGASIDFTVNATGSPPLSYQWFFNGSNIFGANRMDLSLSDLELSQSGIYTVVVTNAFGSATSPPAMLTVIAIPPTIERSPRSETTIVGGFADFTVSAAGSPSLSYQWFFNGSAILGASSADLSLPNVHVSQSGTYSVVVTNAFGAVTSAPAILTVLTPQAGTVIGWGEIVIPDVAPGTRFASIAAGMIHSVALTDGGKVIAWGNNDNGQCAVPEGMADVLAVSAGDYHTLALRSDGTVFAWGDNTFGQSTVPADLREVVAVAAGGEHSLALRSNHTVVAWGADSQGSSTVPAGLADVIAITAGEWHSLALKFDGTAVAWGYISDVPTGLSNVTAIATGEFHNLALKSDGTVVGWGDNSHGQSSAPAGLGDVIAIAAGGYHSLALKSDGTLVAWGDNYSAASTVPTGLSGVTAIAAGQYYSLALRTDGTVVAWGDNDFGQCIAPASLHDLVAIAAGGQHTLALKSDGTVVAWGAGADYTVPAGLSNVIAIAAGQAYSLALKDDGTVAGWGDNFYGQLNVPAGLSGVIAIGAGGGLHSLALKSDGTVVAWGNNSHGQINVPANLNNVIGVAAGNYHSLALRLDGTVVAWGDNESGQTAVPAGLNGIIAISAGVQHSLALRYDGTMVGWGDNSHGQSTVPAGLGAVIAIAAGAQHSLALKSDGTVAVWGDDVDGVSTLPAGLSGVIAIAAGYWHSVALLAESTNGSPKISLCPQSQRADLGSTVDLVVRAFGALPLTYQWFFNSTNPITGSTNAVLQLTSIEAAQSGAYAVVVTNVFGAVTSSPAILAVIGAPPAFSSAPLSQVANVGESVDFTVSAWGSPPFTYQWFFEGGAISGANSTDLHLDNLQLSQSGAYIVVVTNAFGEVTSAPAMLTVIVPPQANWPAGTVVAWGFNENGQTNVPAGLSGVIAIAAGRACNLALKSDGTVVAWGDDSNGQADVPAGLRGVTAVAAGAEHSLALRYDGTVVAWGDNSLGETKVPASLSDVIAVAAGDFHSLTLKSDGTVVAWGYNYYGQANVPPGLAGVIAIAAGAFHSLALKSDGTVVAWGAGGPGRSGNPHFGQSTVPTSLSDVIAIAAGDAHSLALKSDGTVVAWGAGGPGQSGDPHFGQSTVPPNLSGVIAIAAGAYHSLALRSDGTVAAWGFDDDGQSTVPMGLGGIIAIAAGQYHSVVLIGPIVESPPVSQTAEIRSTVRFRVHASGYPVLTYQWFFNGTHALGGITTNASLPLTDVQSAQAGSYAVVVTDTARAVTSTPAMLSVIPAAERRMVPALTLTGQPGSSLNLQAADALGPSPNWVTFDNVALTNTSQWYFDLSALLPSQRFYRAWQPGPSSVVPALDLHMVPALTLAGTVGSTVRVDYINQFGPTNAWVALATVSLTNTSQLYFDVSAIGQPPRLWRLMPVP